jgi:hypothetical protein
MQGDSLFLSPLICYAATFLSKAPQGSTGTPVGECVLKRSGGNPVKPVKRSLFFRKSTTGMPVGIYVKWLEAE